MTMPAVQNPSRLAVPIFAMGSAALLIAGGTLLFLALRGRSASDSKADAGVVVTAAAASTSPPPAAIDPPEPPPVVASASASAPMAQAIVHPPAKPTATVKLVKPVGRPDDDQYRTRK